MASVTFDATSEIGALSMVWLTTNLEEGMTWRRFSDESQFCLQYHDGHIHVWRNREEYMLTTYIEHNHTGPSPTWYSM